MNANTVMMTLDRYDEVMARLRMLESLVVIRPYTYDEANLIAEIDYNVLRNIVVERLDAGAIDGMWDLKDAHEYCGLSAVVGIKQSKDSVE